MRAAIYARRSTEEHQYASLEVQRQEARRFAEEKNWSVDPAHEYIDDAISRSEFKKRPGLASLRAAATQGAFDVIVTRDESRLGGDTLRTSVLVEELLDTGVALYYYFRDERVQIRNAMEKLVSVMRNFSSESEAEKIRERTREALVVKARRGFVAGGRCYGYDNVEIKDGAQRSHVEHRINDEQAEIVREIFRRFAAGEGLRTIAKALNERGVPSPRAFNGQQGWAPSCIREMLGRERYRGVQVYGKTAKAYRGGTKVRLRGDVEKITRTENESIRIVSEDEWNAVAARMAANAKLTGRRGGAAGPPTPFLLAGLSRCGVCGGKIESHRGKTNTLESRVYICGARKDKGAAICTNKLRRPVVGVDRAVIDWVRANVLREELIVETLKELRRRLAEQAATSSGDRERLERQEKEISAKLTKLSHALTETDEKPATVIRLMADLEGELGRIRGRLEAIAATPSVLNLETRRMEREAKRRLENFRGLFERNPEDARKALEALLDGPLSMRPVETANGRQWEIRGVVKTGPIFTTDGVPKGIRTPVSGVKSRGPGPLDDGDDARGALTTVAWLGCKGFAYFGGASCVACAAAAWGARRGPRRATRLCRISSGG